MRINYRLASFLWVAPAMASFQREVVRQGSRTSHRRNLLNDALLNVAIPLADYEKAAGLQLTVRNLQEEGDDFNMEGDEDGSYSFNGYSLKYARCQPVQHFSEDAIKSGEFSPMVTQDIVVLRLCPQKSCLSSETYGCHYNYAEYALTLSEYTTVMLKYAAYKRDLICEWCAECIEDDGGQQRTRRRLAHRRLEEDMNDDGDAAENNAGDDADAANGDDVGANEEADGEDAANDEEQQEGEAEEGNAEDVDVDDNYVYQGSCQNYDTYCSNYATECQDDDDAYLDFEGYLDYMDCAEVRYNDYAYFVKPKCDGSSGAIKMAVYYDNYCIQSAGSDVSIKNLGLGFKDGFFEKFYSSECTECLESEDPPLYDASNLLCNKLHTHSATCTQDMLYDLFENEQDESTECNYIDSIRNGAYNQYGEFSSKSGGGSSWDASITTTQGAVLGVAVALCIMFIILACYLHHTMTNLLLKSLSHRELLPRKARSRSRSSREGSNSKRSSKTGQDADWEAPTIA